MDTKENAQFIMDVRRYAYNKHNEVNHLYDGYPYIIHLDKVYQTLMMVLMTSKTHNDYFTDSTTMTSLYSSCFTHDLIEDCRITYNDLLTDMWKISGLIPNEYCLVTTTADITYAVTNEKGRNRFERANEKYYKGILAVPGASLIKYCDRIANIGYGLMTGSDMVDKYRQEMDHFMTMLPPGDDPYLITAAGMIKNMLK